MPDVRPPVFLAHEKRENLLTLFVMPLFSLRANVVLMLDMKKSLWKASKYVMPACNKTSALSEYHNGRSWLMYSLTRTSSVLNNLCFFCCWIRYQLLILVHFLNKVYETFSFRAVFNYQIFLLISKIPVDYLDINLIIYLLWIGIYP